MYDAVVAQPDVIRGIGFTGPCAEPSSYSPAGRQPAAPRPGVAAHRAIPANPGYGGLTWLNTEKRHAALPADAYCAEGAFGQATFVFPTHGTVVVTLGFAPRTPPADTAAAVLDALGPRRG